MRKSLWSFKTKNTIRHRIHSIMAVVIAFAIDHFVGHYITALLPLGPAQNVLDTYLPVPLAGVGIYLAAFFNQE